MPNLTKIPRRFIEHRIADTPEAKRALAAMASEVRRLRMARLWKISTLAEKVGCSYQQISHIENGDNFPSVALYLKLCKVFGLRKPPMT